MGENGPVGDYPISSGENIVNLPRIREIPSNVEVSGFGEREASIRRLVETVGLPLDNVSKITFRKAGAKDSIGSTTLGSVHMETGELSFYKSLEGLPEISQLGVAAHELAHENDPHKKENAKLYGSEGAMQKTVENVRKIADQTEKSRVFMNWYHKYLFEQKEAGIIDQARFLRETHAIMIELKYTNPYHLSGVLESQDKETSADILNELDNTLLALMPHLGNSKEELNRHIKSLRDTLKQRSEYKFDFFKKRLSKKQLFN